MVFKGERAMVFGREAYVYLAVLTAALLVLSGLFASPARAQGAPTGVVVDLEVVPDVGECGAGDCPDGTRPVTFDATLEVNETDSIPLSPEELAAINDLLADADVAVTVEVPGPNEPVLAGETICLEPGQYDFTAAVVDEQALAEAIAEAVNNTNPPTDPALIAGNVIIGEIDETFVVEECPDDNGDTIDIDDRDQSNVCRNVVNIIVRNVQNPDVDVNNEQVVTGTVSNEQVVDIAQELNISPVIVQQCIQQNADRDAIIGDDDIMAAITTTMMTIASTTTRMTTPATLESSPLEPTLSTVKL